MILHRVSTDEYKQMYIYEVIDPYDARTLPTFRPGQRFDRINASKLHDVWSDSSGKVFANLRRIDAEYARLPRDHHWLIVDPTRAVDYEACRRVFVNAKMREACRAKNVFA